MKTTTCAFCGQELNKGTLGIGGNRKQLFVGTFLDCCPHCHEKYDRFARKDGNRFWTKLENVFHTPGKRIDLEKQLTQQEIASYYVRYYEDAQAYNWEQYSNHFQTVPFNESLLSFYMSSEEAGPHSFINETKLESQMLDMEQQILKKMMLCQEYIFDNYRIFSSNDITCLEYSYDRQYLEGDCLLIHLRIKLNDPRQLTYRPCVVSCAVFSSLSLQGQDTYIDMHIMRFMLQLRAMLQLENMPIIKRDSAAALYGEDHTPATASKPKKTIADYPLLQKFSNFFENLASKFHLLRIICCFIPILSTIGGLVMIASGTPSAVAFFGFCTTVSIAACLFACPMHFLEIIFSLAAGGFTIGLFFALIGSIIGGAIGLALGLALLIYAPAFVTIPYCFKNLLAK